MNNLWNHIRLGDICNKIGSGATPRGGKDVYITTGEISLIRSQNVYNEGFSEAGLVYINHKIADQLKNVIVQPNDILLNITGDSVARCCIVPKKNLPARVNQHVSIIRCNDSFADNRFIRYLLISDKIQNLLFSLASSGATRNAITKTMIEDLVLYIPSDVKEQRAIAHILGTLDEKIELNRQMNETLEEMARAIFKSWFIDFDPVHAKAEGREPFGMDAETAALFPDEFEDSELGMIPKGWSINKIGNSYNVILGQSPPGDSYNEDEVGICLYQGRKDFGFRFPNPRVYTTKPSKIVQKGMVLLSIRAPIGSTNISYEECCIGRGLAAISHKSGILSYCYYSIDSMKSSLEIFEAGGTVFGSLSKNDLQSIRIIESTEQIVSRFDKIIKPIDEKIELLESQISTLNMLRNSLLRVLVNGELNIALNGFDSVVYSE